MKRFPFFSFLMGFMLLFVWSCEKPQIPLPNNKVENGVWLTFKMLPVDNEMDKASMSPTRAVQSIEKVCTKMSVAFFQNGTKVQSKHINFDEDDLSAFRFSLAPGQYEIIAVAHNGVGNASISSPSSVKFANNKVTDTFYYYGVITLDKDEVKEIRMQRAVARFRLKTQDAIPTNVVKMEFYYTGGSSTLNVMSGMGVVKSKQTEVRDVTVSMRGKAGIFDIYTFPHATNDQLNIQIKAFDENGKELLSKDFANVPIIIREETLYEGSFFNGFLPADMPSVMFSADDTWVSKSYHF